MIAFKRKPKLDWSDNTACGHEPKWAPGGDMSHRLSDGTRRNQWGSGEKSGFHRKKDGGRQETGRPSHRMHTKMELDGLMREQGYLAPAVANPGNYLSIDESNVIHIPVGGGLLGHDLAHENEAPFPEKLAEFFVKSLCPPSGTVLDPFSGSGTTVAVADRLGRIGIGMDLRMSQARIAMQRLTHPHAEIQKKPKKEEFHPLFDGVENVLDRT